MTTQTGHFLCENFPSAFSFYTVSGSEVNVADCPTRWAISPLNPTELAFTVPLSSNWIPPLRCAGANLIGKGACIMSTEMNAHVLNLLETYRERERKIGTNTTPPCWKKGKPW